MQLIGMLDSPYVRRVAVTLRLLDLPFEHKPISVFRAFDAFAAVNPVVKAPTLVTDGGVVLMDSTLILAHVERLAGKSLMPASDEGHVAALRLIGLGLAACEKAVQIVYERTQRPAEKLHQPWLERARGQMCAAFDALEQATTARAPQWLCGETITQADVTAAIAFRFVRAVIGDVVPAGSYGALAALSARAEALPAFRDMNFT